MALFRALLLEKVTERNIMLKLILIRKFSPKRSYIWKSLDKRLLRLQKNAGVELLNMKMFQIAFKLCCMRLSCVHFCKLKKYKNYHFCDSRLHVLLPCKQPQIEIFSKKFQSKKKHATGFHFQHLKYLSLATIENRLPINKLLLFEIVMVLSDPCQF